MQLNWAAIIPDVLFMLAGIAIGYGIGHKRGWRKGWNDRSNIWTECSGK